MDELSSKEEDADSLAGFIWSRWAGGLDAITGGLDGNIGKDKRPSSCRDESRRPVIS